jgi:hypothetical protein
MEHFCAKMSLANQKRERKKERGREREWLYAKEFITTSCIEHYMAPLRRSPSPPPSWPSWGRKRPARESISDWSASFQIWKRESCETRTKKKNTTHLLRLLGCLLLPLGSALLSGLQVVEDAVDEVLLLAGHHEAVLAAVLDEVGRVVGVVKGAVGGALQREVVRNSRTRNGRRRGQKENEESRKGEAMPWTIQSTRTKEKYSMK